MRISKELNKPGK